MGANRFWILFGALCLFLGIAFIAATLGMNVFAGSAARSAGDTWLLAIVGIAASGAGAGILYFARAAVARDRRLMQSGVDLVATVADIRRSAIVINEQVLWHVRYRYEYAGRAMEGESQALPGDAVQGYRPGDRVNIKVDPQRPEESLFLDAT